MTSDDYIAWANEYRQQVDVLDKAIKEVKSNLKKRFASHKDRQIAEQRIVQLNIMRTEAIKTVATLEERARQIKAKEDKH